MRKGILVLGTILLFGFSSSKQVIEEYDVTISENTRITEEIKIFNQIIEKKLKEADLLENRGIALLKKDEDSEEGLKHVQEAQLQRMMTLKYKAAIACRTHFSK